MAVYLIRYRNVDVNSCRAHNCNQTLLIQLEPGKTNMSKQSKINGWLGTTDDLDAYALGCFDNIKDLCIAIRKQGHCGKKIFDKVKNWFESDDKEPCILQMRHRW